MIDFWLTASLLLLVALSFLLIPLLRGRRAQTEEDRTALNVALYQERLAELQEQQEEGVLSVAQMDSGRADAVRELLADTEGTAAESVSRLGKPLPLLAAVLVPVLGLALYLHFGASDKVELSREFAQPPGSLVQMTERLERAVKAQPDSGESIYILARSYMALGRPAAAAAMFERVVAYAGRQPELLGQWAQALYFAGNKAWTPQIQTLVDEALRLDPKEGTSLGLKGINAYDSQRYLDALAYWNQAVSAMNPKEPLYAVLKEGMKQAAARAKDMLRSSVMTEVSTVSVAALKVRVSISPDILKKTNLNDSVFVFVREPSGSGMPLAAKRLRVGDLPVDVGFSDADAMITGKKISQADILQVTARVSKTGEPTSGEWSGQGLSAFNSRAAKLEVIIDKAGP